MCLRMFAFCFAKNHAETVTSGNVVFELATNSIQLSDVAN